MKFSAPEFVSSKIILLYERSDKIRKTFFDLEDRFDGAFLAPEIFPIPDEAPLEFPRGFFKSKNGYSNLSVSPIKAELTTEYDENLNHDFEKCFNYILEKSKLFNIFIKTTGVTQIGLACVIIFRCPSLDENESVLAEKLEKKLLSSSISEGSLYDLRLNMARVIDDKLFLNTNLSNYRKYGSKNPIIEQYPRLCNLTLDEFGLEVRIEVNDKYGYNNGEECTGFDDMNHFIYIMKDEVSKVTDKLIGEITDDL